MRNLDLKEYRELIKLDEPFKISNPQFESQQIKFDLVLNLINQLEDQQGSGFNPRNISIDLNSYKELRNELYRLVITREPYPFPNNFLETFDGLLQDENAARGVTKIESIPLIGDLFPNSRFTAKEYCSLWLGDITTLQTDAIVNAANSSLLGCFIPFHNCIDNAIHTRAGPQVREDCAKIIEKQGFPEPIGEAKITRAKKLKIKRSLFLILVLDIILLLWYDGQWNRLFIEILMLI